MSEITAGRVAALIRSTPPRHPNPNAATAHDVITVAARLFGVTVADLIGPSRHRQTVEARQVAMTVAYASTTLSYPELGDLFDRDHSTVVHAVKRVLERDAMRSWAAAVDAEVQAIAQREETP